MLKRVQLSEYAGETPSTRSGGQEPCIRVEAFALAGRVIVMARGRAVFDGSVARVRAELESESSKPR